MVKTFTRHEPTRTVGTVRIDHDDVHLLRLLARGLPVEAVARRLDLSDRTVRRRTRAICDRLGVATVIEAVVWAAHSGLLRGGGPVPRGRGAP